MAWGTFRNVSASYEAFEMFLIPFYASFYALLLHIRVKSQICYSE